MSNLLDIRYSLRRSRIRVAILLALLRLDESYLSDLARLAGADPARADGALYGDNEEYRRSDGLVSLGLVVAKKKKDRVVFSLTDLGRQVATAWQRDMRHQTEHVPQARS